MRQFLALSFLVATLAPAAEAARLDSRKLTCRDLTGRVAEQESLVVSFGRGLFHRVVRNQGSCHGSDRRMQIAVFPTLDNPSCVVGYVCNGGSSPRTAAEGEPKAEKGEGGISVIGTSAPGGRNPRAGR